MKAILERVKIKADKLCKKEWYPLCVVLVAFIFHAFALDLVGMLSFALIGALWLVLYDDIKPVLPLLLCAVFIVSTQNSPGYTTEGYYYRSDVLIAIGVGAGLLVLSTIYRIIRNYKQLGKTRLFVPIALLAVSFMMAGIGNQYYLSSLIFGGAQGVFLLWLYILFSSTLKSEKGLFDYIATILSSIALLIAMEVVFVYLLHIVQGGVFDSSWKVKIITGWGVSNVAGELLVLLTVFSIYKMHKSKHKLFYELSTLFCMTMVVFCLNRAGMFFGLPILLVLFLIVCVKSVKQPKGSLGKLIAGLLLYISLSYITVTVLVKFTSLGGIFDYFATLIFSSDGTVNTSGRLKIWLQAWEYFKSSPIWGVGYYQSFMDTLDRNKTVFMALSHNSLVQAGMSGGILGLGLFVYFLVSCAISVLKKHKNIMFVIIFCGLFFIITMFDTIYFIPYCTMFLILILVVNEKCVEYEKIKTKEKEIKEEMIKNERRKR